MDNNIPNKNLFERIFSIDELKFSGLTLILFVLVGFGCYSLLTKGDVPSNLTALIEINIGAIAGVNAFSFVGNGFGMSKTQNGMMPMQNQYGYSNSYSPYGNSSMGMNGMGMSGMNGMPMNSMGMNQSSMGSSIPNSASLTPPVQQMPIVNSGATGAQNKV